MAALHWMLGQHAAALHALLPAPASPDPTTHQAPGPPAPAPAQAAAEDAPRLDFVRYCSAAAPALLTVAAGLAPAVAAAADRAADALRMRGLPAMALEAAVLADALSARLVPAPGLASGSESGSAAVAARDAAVGAQRACLAAGALLWAALGAQAPPSDPNVGSGMGLGSGFGARPQRLARVASGAPAQGALPWRAGAEQGLAALAAAGVAGIGPRDTAAVLARLGELRAALLPPAVEAAVPETPRTPASASEAGGRSQSLGYIRRRCVSPPCSACASVSAYTVSASLG